MRQKQNFFGWDAIFECTTVSTVLPVMIMSVINIIMIGNDWPTIPVWAHVSMALLPIIIIIVFTKKHRLSELTIVESASGRCGIYNPGYYYEFCFPGTVSKLKMYSALPKKNRAITFIMNDYIVEATFWHGPDTCCGLVGRILGVIKQNKLLLRDQENGNKIVNLHKMQILVYDELKKIVVEFIDPGWLKFVGITGEHTIDRWDGQKHVCTITIKKPLLILVCN